MRSKDLAKALVVLAIRPRLITTLLRNLAGNSQHFEAVWGHVPIRRTFRVDLPDNKGFCYSATPDDFVGRLLYWKGWMGYEQETTRVFYDLARKAQLIIDVGAHTGLYTLMACAACPTASVVAIEPVQRTFERLITNIELNGWSERCRPIQAVAANSQGVIPFHVPSVGLPQTASMDIVESQAVHSEMIQVPATTIDAICGEYDKIDLVKIDVEGYEAVVLEGMRRVLKTSRPALILEFLPQRDTEIAEQILRHYGYRFYHLTNKGAIAVNSIVPDTNTKYRNYLCIAKMSANAD